MGYIILDGVDFQVIPSENQEVTISYRKLTDPDVPSSYFIYATGVVVLPSGDFLSGQFTILGLEDNTWYVVKVENSCNDSFSTLTIYTGFSTTTTTTTIPTTTTTSTSTTSTSTTSTSTTTSSTTTTTTTMAFNPNVFWTWVEDDPYLDLFNSVDTLIYEGTDQFAFGEDIVADYTLAPPDRYLVLKVFDLQTIKEEWYNTSFNYGTIPDSVWRGTFPASGNWRYYVTRVPVTFSPGPTTFSV